MAPVVVDSSAVRAETPPPRRRQSGGASPKTSGSSSDEWTRSPLSRPRHPAASRQECAGDFSAPKPRRVSDEAFLSPVASRISPFAQVSAEDSCLPPGHPAGKENLPLSPVRAPPRQPRTPGPRTPMPTVREHGGLDRTPELSQRSPDLSQWTPVLTPASMDPTEAWERGLLRSPAPPGLPEPSVRNTFLTFESPLRTDRPQSPPKSVPANHLFGSVEPDWWGLASPPPALLAAPPAWPPCTPEPQLFQPQHSQLNPDVVALPLRLSEFLPEFPHAAGFDGSKLPAVPSMQCFADPSLSVGSMPPPPAVVQQAPTASTMSTPLVTSAQAPLPECPAAQSGDRAFTLPAVDAAEQGADCSQVAVTCAEAVMTSEEPEFGEQAEAAEWSQLWAQVPQAQPQALCYTDQFQQAQSVQPQVFDVAMLNSQSQPTWGQEHRAQQQFSNHVQMEIPHQFTQQMQFVPQQVQHQHVSGQMQHEMSQPMPQNFTDSVHLHPEMLQQHSFQDHEQQMLQQHVPQQQMPQQMLEPMQQSICDQMQQLQHVQQQMQHQEMQHQFEQHMHQQMEQQMQQHMQQQQLQEQTQQMFQMLQHQLSQSQQPPSHVVASSVSRAPVKLSELLQLPDMPPAAARGDGVLGSCSGGSAGRPEDLGVATRMAAEAPEIAAMWADELVVPAPSDSAPEGVSILSDLLRELNEPESAQAPVSAPRTGRRNRGPRSSGRR